MIARLIRRAMGRGSARTSSLSQAAQLEEPVNPRIVRNTNTVATLSIVAFFAWAAVTNVNEVAHTRGEIVPQGFAQTIQHLEGGMVAEIQTREGNIVEAGDPLIRLSDTTLRNERRSIRATLRTHRLEAERLRAFVDDRAIDLSDFMLANRKVLQDTIATFNAMKAARRREESVVVEQIRQRQKKLKSLQASVNVAASNIALYERLHTIRSQLHAVGLVSLVLLLETQARLNEALGEKERLDTELRIARDEITEYQERREALVLRHRDDATQRLSRVLAAIEQEEAALERIDERIARLVLRAPTRGLVKGLSVNTIGAVIQPGQALMDLVPLGPALEAVVQIDPRDIGHIRVGQPVNIKVTSFDFARYGAVPGHITQISATTFKTDEGRTYFKARVDLSKNYVARTEHHIIPGMTVLADIVTGEKTILQYLIKPIHLSIQSALTER